MADWTIPKEWMGSEVLTKDDLNAHAGAGGNTEYLYDNCPVSNQYMNNGTSIAQLNMRIESGTKYIGVTNSSYGSASVTFNTAFGTGPRVVSDSGNANVNCATSAVGTSGLTIYIQNGSGGTFTGSYYPSWIAIGA